MQSVSLPSPLPQQPCSVHYATPASHNQHQFQVLLLQLHQMLGSQPLDASQQEDPSDSNSNSNIAGGGGGGGSTSISSHVPARTLKELLHDCVKAVAHSDWETALQLLVALAPRVSVQGDSAERLSAFFAASLATRVGAGLGDIPAFQVVCIPGVLPRPDPLQHSQQPPPPPSPQELQAAHLALNQVTPFIRFAHLTANQAILEALHEGAQAVHIVDLDIMQGVQWPPLMQALAQRPVVPRLRITGCIAQGEPTAALEQTGLRLAEFARSLDLPFQFHTLVRSADDWGLQQLAGIAHSLDEALAVNCVLTLHTMLEHGPGPLYSLLQAIRSLHPQVVTLAEREANHNQAELLDRFSEAMLHYGALFESMEATLPPRSAERVNVEHLCFGREIGNIIASEGTSRIHRHQTSDQWRQVLEAAGFSSNAFSTFAVSQARLLLRLHYPSEGYTLEEIDGFLCLGWQNRPLYAVSSWC